MHHLAAFFNSLALNSVYAQLAAIADAGLTRNAGNQFIAPSNMQVLGAHWQGVTTIRAQIQAPSLRQIAYPEIAPGIQAAITAPPTLGAWRNYYGNGPRIMMNEAFGVYASEGGTGASPTVAALWVTSAFTPSPGGQRITLVGTSSNTLVAQQWTLSTITFETQLAAGRYSVVGIRIQCAAANYGRLVFPGQTQFRPGVVVQAAIADKPWIDEFHDPTLGEFGQFDFNNPPQLELLGNAAGAQTAVVFMDVVKIG